MSSENRILYEFPHSHFCEIARWGMDHKGLRYSRHCVLPGYHAYYIKKIAPKSHVPVLFDDGVYVQGSDEILNHLEVHYPENSLNHSLSKEQVRTMEADIASSIGVPLRRLCYAHLLERPELVRYFFMHRSSGIQNLVFRALYPMLSKRIRNTYNCTPSGAQSAKEEMARALDRYDRILGNAEYLGGEAFSRVDITFASLAVFMVMPEQYPVAWPRELETMELTSWFRDQRERPTYQFVERLYKLQREPRLGG